MYPISIFTWRLGKVNSDIMEPLILSEEKIKEIFSELSTEYTGLFYLATCQRIIIATDSSSELLTQNLYLKFIRSLGLNPRYFIKPEMYHGIEALHHLSMVISSLDSVVIGEVQIQGQFKDAYKNLDSFFSNSLKRTLSNIIRVGKRVRSQSSLSKDKISTITLVEDILSCEFQDASSIGIVGTGKMGLGILEFLKDKYENLHLYTRTSSRVGKILNGVTVENFNNINPHEVLILATSSSQPIITKTNVEKCYNEKVTIVDLGMPRNCDPYVSKRSSISLIGMEDLVIHSKRNAPHSVLKKVYSILEKEIDAIVNEHHKKEKANAIISLRKDLLETAKMKKSELKNEDPKYSQKFDQFINQLIHVSQRHLENVLLEKASSSGAMED